MNYKDKKWWISEEKLIDFNLLICETNNCVCVVISAPIDSHVEKIVGSNFGLHCDNFELKIND
jgi:hypothetical protein